MDVNVRFVTDWQPNMAGFGLLMDMSLDGRNLVINHFNPAEPRDWRGRWTEIGGALRATARSTLSQAEVEDRIRNLPPDKAISITGINIANIPSKGYRVKIGTDTRHYRDPGEVALAIINGEHTTGGVASKRSRKIQVVRQEAKRRAKTSQVANFQINRYPNRDPWIDQRIIDEVESAANLQRKYVPAVVNNTYITIDGLAKSFQSGRGSKKWLGMYGGRGGYGTPAEGKRRMSLTAELFRNPSEARERLRDALDRGWWVDIGPNPLQTYTLAEVTQSHEYGHGIHRLMSDRAAFKTPSNWSYILEDSEQGRFWLGFVRTINGADWPQVTSSYNDRKLLAMDQWFKKNKKWLRSSISTYATTNYNEMLAELWCEYVLNPNPRPPAKYYGDYVMSRIGGMQ